jgi:predicted nucleotidyltransferase
VILFGSAASGAFSESSDVDLVLVLPNEAALEDRRRLREAVSDLEVAHGLRSDPAPWIAKDGWPKQKE